MSHFSKQGILVSGRTEFGRPCLLWSSLAGKPIRACIVPLEISSSRSLLWPSPVPCVVVHPPDESFKAVLHEPISGCSRKCHWFFIFFIAFAASFECLVHVYHLCSSENLCALLCSQDLAFAKWDSFVRPEVLCPHFSQPPLLDSRTCTLCTIIVWLCHFFKLVDITPFHCDHSKSQIFSFFLPRANNFCMISFVPVFCMLFFLLSLSW